MKQFMDILAVIISGSFLVFGFLYIVNIQAALFSELTSENKPETSTDNEKSTNNKTTKTTKQEIEEIQQKRAKLEEEHARIDSFGFHLHSKRKY